MKDAQLRFRNYYEEGIKAKTLGQIETSIELFRNALKLDKEHVSTLIELGESYFLLGQRDTAIQYYDQVLSIEPDNALALVKKGYALHFYDSGQRRHGKELCRKALRLSPQSDRVLSEAAMALMDEAPEEAATLIDKVLSRDPESAEALFAKAVLEEFRGRIEEAVGLYYKASELQPFYREQLYARIDYCCATGLNEKALTDLYTFLSFDRGNARYHRVEGRLLMKMRDWGKAAEAFSEAVEKDKRDVDSLVGLGRTYAMSGDHRRALENYMEALKVQPRCAEASANIAAIYCDIYRDYETALKFAEEAVVFDEKLVTGWVNRGIILMHLRNVDESMRSFDTALAIDPGNVIALLRKGALLTDVMGLFDEATRVFNTALRLAPDNVEGWWGLSQVAMHEGDHQAVVHYLDQLLAIAPSHVEAQWNRALHLQKIGREKDAEEALRKLSLLEPSNPRSRMALRAILDFPNCPVPLEVVLLLRNTATISEGARNHLRIIADMGDPLFSTVFVGLLLKSMPDEQEPLSTKPNALSILRGNETRILVNWLAEGGAQQLLNSLRNEV